MRLFTPVKELPDPIGPCHYTQQPGQQYYVPDLPELRTIEESLYVRHKGFLYNEWIGASCNRLARLGVVVLQGNDGPDINPHYYVHPRILTSSIYGHEKVSSQCAKCPWFEDKRPSELPTPYINLGESYNILTEGGLQKLIEERMLHTGVTTTTTSGTVSELTLETLRDAFKILEPDYKSPADKDLTRYDLLDLEREEM